MKWYRDETRSVQGLLKANTIKLLAAALFISISR